MTPASALTSSLLLVALCVGCASESSARRDTTTEVALPPYQGPKVRVLLDEFEWGVTETNHEVTYESEDEDGSMRRSKWSVEGNKMCTGLQASLRASLASTNRFIVSDRKGLEKLKRERKLADDGFVKESTAPKKGEVNSADLLVRGTVLEWEEDAGGSGGGGGIGGLIGGTLGVGGLGYSTSKGKVVISMEIIDLETLDLLFSDTVRGEANSSGLTFGGFGWGGGAVLAGGFSQYENKPMGDAIRKAIAESIRLIATRVPDSYYRHGA